jgi:hypothetical protein
MSLPVSASAFIRRECGLGLPIVVDALDGRRCGDRTNQAGSKVSDVAAQYIGRRVSHSALFRDGLQFCSGLVDFALGLAAYAAGRSGSPLCRPDSLWQYHGGVARPFCRCRRMGRLGHDAGPAGDLHGRWAETLAAVPNSHDRLLADPSSLLGGRDVLVAACRAPSTEALDAIATPEMADSTSRAAGYRSPDPLSRR